MVSCRRLRTDVCSLWVDGVHHFQDVAVTTDLFNVRVWVVLQRDSDVEIAVVVAIQLADLEHLESVQGLHQFHCLVAVQHWSYPLPRRQLHRWILTVDMTSEWQYSLLSVLSRPPKPNYEWSPSSAGLKSWRLTIAGEIWLKSVGLISQRKFAFYDFFAVSMQLVGVAQKLQ